LVQDCLVSNPNPWDALQFSKEKNSVGQSLKEAKFLHHKLTQPTKQNITQFDDQFITIIVLKHRFGDPKVNACNPKVRNTYLDLQFMLTMKITHKREMQSILKPILPNYYFLCKQIFWHFSLSSLIHKCIFSVCNKYSSSKVKITFKAWKYKNLKKSP
jgi:hypothetical protein